MAELQYHLRVVNVHHYVHRNYAYRKIGYQTKTGNVSKVKSGELLRNFMESIRAFPYAKKKINEREAWEQIKHILLPPPLLSTQFGAI